MVGVGWDGHILANLATGGWLTCTAFAVNKDANIVDSAFQFRMYCGIKLYVFIFHVCTKLLLPINLKYIARLRETS